MGADLYLSPPPVEPWVLVIVYEYPSKTKPIIVNTYGYPTKAKAQTAMRKTKVAAKEAGGVLIACRVRPLRTAKGERYRHVG